MKIGDILTIYQDWQTNKKELGKAVLIEKIRNGSTFIVDDFFVCEGDEHIYRIPESLTPVYNYQRWRVQFNELTDYGKQSIKVSDIRDKNIRFLETVGMSRSSIPEDFISNEYLKDKFLKINGVEVF